ncbi:MAG: hypothetical protein K0Q55_409 [Verrucomicrobia bacterium]|jgi:hypothetical protein|nr:hypothetical protein [Verrucomicrobiota bacterium]
MLVNLLMLTRMVRFCRSQKLAETWDLRGLPLITRLRVPRADRWAVSGLVAPLAVRRVTVNLYQHGAVHFLPNASSTACRYALCPFVKFLLTEWWEQHGRREFFVSYMLQKLGG